MAEIAPLKGLVYNASLTGNLRDLVSPPYDVVTPEQQAAFHRAHPNNVMHLILGAQHEDDQTPYDWHERAAVSFSEWQAEKILVRQKQQAIYYAESDFTDLITGQRKTRRGFICLLGLEDFNKKGAVRPHERTFSSTKAERLNLMKNVQANLSSIFAVYPDETGQSIELLMSGVHSQPMFDFMDPEGRGHRLWPVTDESVIRKLRKLIQDKTVYIADGHHRYETSLNYRRYMQENGQKIGPRSPLNYTMTYLCAISDPGLTILPAHHLISESLNLSKKELETALNKYFHVRTFSFTKTEERGTRKAFLRNMEKEGRTENALGLYTRLAKTYYLLKPKEEAAKESTFEAWPPLLRKLDTVILTSLVLQGIIGLTAETLDDPQRITYTSRARDAIRQVNEGKVEMACILNPTRIEQVQTVAEAGLIMPRKSTYFFPKVIAGMLFNPLSPLEEIEPLL